MKEPLGHVSEIRDWVSIVLLEEQKMQIGLLSLKASIGAMPLRKRDFLTIGPPQFIPVSVSQSITTGVFVLRSSRISRSWALPHQNTDE